MMIIRIGGFILVSIENMYHNHPVKIDIAGTIESISILLMICCMSVITRFIIQVICCYLLLDLLIQKK